MSSVKKRCRKRLKPSAAASEEGIDRISELPEALIIEILSLVPTRENIRTGVLAKKWRNLWTRVPNLYFTDDFIDPDNENDEEPLQFVNYVSETLDLVSCSTKVKSLSVDWHYFGFKPEIDSWVRFSVENKIEKLELDNYQGSEGYCYKLPKCVFTCSSFRELRLGFCSFKIKGSVSWTCLKKLTIIVGAGFTNELLEKIVAGSPALEILDLRLVWGISRVHLGKSGVKKLSLTVQSWHPGDLEEEEAGFEILAPNVESLEVSGYFDTCKLVDMKSLIEATLFGLKHVREYPDFNQGVLSSLLNVQTLTLGTWVIKGIYMLPVDRRPSLSKCKCLTLDTHLWKEDPSAIASLLKCAPEIEILIVTSDGYFSKHKNRSGYDNSYIDQYWTYEETASINLTCLRTVKFMDFWAYRTVAFPFVKFLLKNARGLQKVIIHLDTKGNFYGIDPTKLSGTSEKLLSFPRSSPDAKLLIHE